MVTYQCSRARTLLSSSFPWFATLQLYLNLQFCVRHPLSVPVFRLVTTSASQPSLRTLTPSLMPLPQGVAAIVVPNKVYGITDLWNWIFSLCYSSGLTGLRPGASGYNWPLTEPFFFLAAPSRWADRESDVPTALVKDRETGRVLVSVFVPGN